MKIALAVALFFLLTSPAHAQTGDCEPAEADAYLDINNVRAHIFNNGALFWKGGAALYEVPKYGAVQAIFATSLWIGGKVNNVVRTSASTYGPWEMWPGPLDDQGNPPADCKPFDRIYSVYQRDINQYEKNGIATDDLLDWPWELGAPVVDGDGNPDNYNLAGGDRPEIRGHQTLWWVMNDLGNTHERTDTDPIGLEVQVTAFAAASDDVHIDNATLYRYKLIYKGDAPLEDAYIGLYQDVDLGSFVDDYIGSDTTLGLGYTYNADNFDEWDYGYGEAPPAVGFDVVQGPLVESDGLDNDHDGETDEPGERLSMTAFIYYIGGGGVQGDPETGGQYYTYMQGKWKDGSSFTVGGNGRDFSRTPTSYFFPGDPVTGEGWSELNPAIDGSLPPITPSDRRSAIASGPFTMQPGDEQEITFAIVWARGEDNLDSVTRLREASATVQEAYDAGFEIEIPERDPLQAIQPAAPADNATGQPVNPTLYWLPANMPSFYEIQWSQDEHFTDPQMQSEILTNSMKLPDLMPMSTYFWRVRPVSSGEIGPWSPVWRFSTSGARVGDRAFSNFGFMAVQNAAGPIEPPDMAAFAFNSSGFPVLEGTLTPIGSYPAQDRPTRGVQQATNESAWGIHTGGDDRQPFEGTDGESFVERTFRNGREAIGEDGFEWRFPRSCLDQTNGVIEEADCLAYRAFDDNLTIEVPFELWNIGSIIDPADDYRMIPFICEEACGAGLESMVFDFAGDHSISGGANDPYSDWIFWNKPADGGAAPGEQGYLDFFFGGSGAGDEVMANMVLVNWNGGDVPPYEVSLPEPGTVFRIVTNNLTQVPLLAAPANNAVLKEPSATLYWNANPQTVFQLQIDTAPDFRDPDLDLYGLTDPFYRADNYPRNATYYWRVRMFSVSGFQLSDWSEAWRFYIPLNVGSEAGSADLLEYTLEPGYPNPFRSTATIRYALPEPAEVYLEVFDTLGRRVRVLVDRNQPAGRHEAVFDAANLSNGVYFYRLRAGKFSETRSVVLMR